MEQADKVKNCTRLSLTSSFRFGQPIADLASDLLNAFKGDPVRLRGLGQHPRSKAQAFIARTNAGLLEEAENLISAGVSHLHFVGTSERQGYNPAAAYGFSDLLDVYHLRKKDPGQVKSSYFRRFDSYEQLKELASDHRARDLELNRLVSFIDRWQDEVPDLLNRFAKASVSPEAAQATLATAHRAKGLEWDTVRMADDFLDLTEASRQPRDLKEQAFAEEVNLLYVAATRSRTKVEIPEHLQRWHQAWSRRGKSGEVKNIPRRP
jgi:F-box protein 18 (helicase)